MPIRAQELPEQQKMALYVPFLPRIQQSLIPLQKSRSDVKKNLSHPEIGPCSNLGQSLFEILRSGIPVLSVVLILIVLAGLTFTWTYTNSTHRSIHIYNLTFARLTAGFQFVISDDLTTFQF